MSSVKKGKANKLKIGQKVEASPHLVDWYSGHLSWLFGQDKNGKDGYNKGEKEILEESLRDVYAWSNAKLGGLMPHGIVSHYGDYDCDIKTGKTLKRKNVYVDFIFKTEIGDIEYGAYFSESDLFGFKKI
jgi:hypothetical protein